MTGAELSQAVEKWLGIKADPLDLARFKSWLWEKHGGESPEILEKAFSSGQAAGFLTVNETYFFREPAHFNFLNDFLSSLIDLYKAAQNNPVLRICSAAVSTGCEAYSIAMLIETFNKGLIKPIFYTIDAFDINPGAIETALGGNYSPRTFREDGSSFHHIAENYMQKKSDPYKVDIGLKENINFFVHNLLDEFPAKEYDLIFFRNAFIYFTPQSRIRVLNNLASSLKEGGILIMGVSETAGVKHPSLDAKNRDDVFYFQKNNSVL